MVAELGAGPSDPRSAFARKAEAVGIHLLRANDESGVTELFSGLAVAPRRTAAMVSRYPALAERHIPISAGCGPHYRVVTVAAFGVAESGNVAVVGSAEDRAACFLAEHLLLLLHVEDLVPTLDAALERVAALVAGGARYVTLMTGPSRTADIERVLTVGVHGLTALTIVVVGQP